MPSPSNNLLQGSDQGLDIQLKAQAIVASQQEKADRHIDGVRWPGLSPEPPKVETVEAVAQRLQRQHEANQAFRNSPRGRFFWAVTALEEAGFIEEGDRLKGIYRRSIADEFEPFASLARACGACLTILERIDRKEAREAALALSELLLGEPLARAA